MPSAEPSPRPWREDNYCIYDANGKIVAAISSTTDNADAALIVDAVNALDAVHALSIKLYDPLRKAEAERDRLRDIVRRLADRFCDFRFDEEDAAILREARAAIGEGETPTGKGVGR